MIYEKDKLKMIIVQSNHKGLCDAFLKAMGEGYILQCFRGDTEQVVICPGDGYATEDIAISSTLLVVGKVLKDNNVVSAFVGHTEGYMFTIGAKPTKVTPMKPPVKPKRKPIGQIATQPKTDKGTG